MTHTVKTTFLMVSAVCMMLALAILTFPALTQAANYAYIDSAGKLQTVTATDWMTAIATAPNIMFNSGVYLLKSEADLDHIESANK